MEVYTVDRTLKWCTSKKGGILMKKFLRIIFSATLALFAFICIFAGAKTRSIIEHDQYSCSQEWRMAYSHEELITGQGGTGWTYRMLLSLDDISEILAETEDMTIYIPLRDENGKVLQLPDHRPMVVRFMRSSLEKAQNEAKRMNSKGYLIKAIGEYIELQWSPSLFYEGRQSDGATYNLQSYQRSEIVFDLETELMTKFGLSSSRFSMICFGVEMLGIFSLLTVIAVNLRWALPKKEIKLKLTLRRYTI